MGYKLCTAEKPSVAKDIAKVIGADEKHNGYYEGNGYIVTWAIGHLVGLAEPEQYGFVSQREMYGDKREIAYDELPLIPKEFQLVTIEATEAQFNIVKALMHRNDVDMIIDCGDMGAEGHILQWFIREKAKCRKPIMRFCATSMTDEAIKCAMKNLKPIEDFDGIIRGEFCKKKADWIMGMSLSRAESLKYNTGINVGRVQSPTLYFVVKRYLEVKKFQVTDYYGMEVETSEGFKAFWNKDFQGIFDQKIKDSENRVLVEQEVEKKTNLITENGIGIIEEIEKKKKGADRPQLYDITELQRDANRRYGYTAAITLAAAQALYENYKVLSYPRTDSRYITSDLQPYMVERVRQISTINNKYKECAEKLIENGLNIDKKIVDDSKVTDHHALIPTERIEGFDMEKLIPNPEERKKGLTKEILKNVLELILTRMLVSFSQMYIFEQTSIKLDVSGIIFTASGKKEIQPGWRDVEKYLNGKIEEDEEQSNEQIFLELTKGQKISIRNCKVVSKKTSPPKYHTEATLLTAMENAGASLGKDGSILKGKGIGTQATRAEIIKKLFDTGYVETLKKGKTNYIIPTGKGLGIVKVLPSELYSPKITADWETKISRIADGKMKESEFMTEFIDFIREKVKEVKEKDIEVSFKVEKQAVATCPFCGREIYKHQKKGENFVSFYCANQECCFNLSTNDMTIKTFTRKPLTEKQALKFIENGKVTLTCAKKSGNGSYKREFLFTRREVNGKIYCNVKAGDFK